VSDYSGTPFAFLRVRQVAVSLEQQAAATIF